MKHPKSGDRKLLLSTSAKAQLRGLLPHPTAGAKPIVEEAKPPLLFILEAVPTGMHPATGRIVADFMDSAVNLRTDVCDGCGCRGLMMAEHPARVILRVHFLQDSERFLCQGCTPNGWAVEIHQWELA